MSRLEEIIENTAKVFPHNKAIEDYEGNAIDYSSLETNIKRVSNNFQNIGIKPSQSVSFILSKNVDSILCLLAVLHSECNYIPIDELSPPKRQISVIVESRCTALLFRESSVDSQLLESLPTARVHKNFLGDISLAFFNWENHSDDFASKNLATILFTSGSTGIPKGVCLKHENMLPFIRWSKNITNLTEQSRVISIAPLHFDLSVYDIFSTLMSGGCVYLLPAKEAKNPMLISMLLEKWSITHIYTTPTMLKLIIQYGKVEKYNQTHLKNIIFAGEQMPVETLQNVINTWPDGNYFNFYGPTETNVITHYQVDTSLPIENPIPIGIECPYAKCKILIDNVLYFVEPHRSGELVACGESMFDQYKNASSEHVFYLDETGNKWYKTGDSVEINGNGQIIYKGRLNRMVKRHGYRVELDEIAKAMSTLDDVSDAAVIFADEKLVAFYTDSNFNISEIEIRKHLGDLLPVYMIPDKFVKILELPKSSNHKIDYQKLNSLLDE